MAVRTFLLCLAALWAVFSRAPSLFAETVSHHGQTVNVSGSTEDCLSCHDGHVAKDVSYCIGECPLSAAHPVNRPYPPKGKEHLFRPVNELRGAGIRFVNGTMVCISCHDLRNPGRHQLVIEMAGSRLCLACHLK